MKNYIGVLLLLFGATGLKAQKNHKLETSFDESPLPPVPNYSLNKHWSALPDRKDMADRVPFGSDLIDMQETAQADVFYLYPTIFTAEPINQYLWNADVNDTKMNASVDNSAVLNQSTAFNGSCRVYAPRYRQAHYSAFTSSDRVSAAKALALSYEDIRAAFEYYLEHYNQGRPIVIAGHSQGTLHAVHLVKDYFDGKPLQGQLVEAYLIGMPIKEAVFENIEASNRANHVGGFVTWNTFKTGYIPKYYNNGLHEAICTNPLTWNTDESYASRELNVGGVGRKFKFVDRPVDAEVHKGLLWVNKPYVRGRVFINIKIWHRADINFYWMNIRENVALRIAKFYKNKENNGE
jgi:pimeloyl-ACP methyl ester carboxylesterase